MRIQITEEVFAALTASNHGYIIKQRGEVEIKVTRQLLLIVRINGSISEAEYY